MRRARGILRVPRYVRRRRTRPIQRGISAFLAQSWNPGPVSLRIPLLLRSQQAAVDLAFGPEGDSPCRVLIATRETPDECASAAEGPGDRQVGFLQRSLKSGKVPGVWHLISVRGERYGCSVDLAKPCRRP